MKNKILFALLFVLSYTINAQDLLWEHFYGSTNNDYAHHIIPDEQGNFYTIGYTESYGTGEWGKPDMWLCKFSEDGGMLWDATYGQPDSLDKAYFGLLEDDGVLLIGERMEDIVYGNGMKGVIVKADLDGNELWSKTYVGDNKDALRFIQPVPDGGYIACGVTRSGAAQFVDAWVLRLDDEFNISWQKNYGGEAYDSFRCIYPTDDGGFLAGGFTNSSGAGSYDIWFVKMNDEGDILWEQYFGNEYPNRLNYFTPISNGNLVITGYTQIDAIETDYTFVMEIDQDGNLVWENHYLKNLNGEGFYIEEIQNSGFVVAATDGNELGGAYQTDGWILRLDEAGVLLWDYFIHGDASDVFDAARQTKDGDIIAAGGTMSNGSGMNDLWLTLLSDSTFTTSISEVNYPKAHVYPNPAATKLMVELAGDFDKAQATLVDLGGRLLLNKLVHEKAELNVSQFEPGVYFLHINTGKSVETQKVIIR